MPKFAEAGDGIAPKRSAQCAGDFISALGNPKRNTTRKGASRPGRWRLEIQISGLIAVSLSIVAVSFRVISSIVSFVSWLTLLNQAKAEDE
jgi:hypothetical protein